MRVAHAGSLVVALVVLGCSSKGGGAPAGSSAPAPAALTISPVTWNPSSTAVGTVQAVLEQDKTVVVFGSSGVISFTSGAMVASDATVTSWKAAAAIPSADGLSTWTIGVSNDGHVLRVDGSKAPEDVSDRYGLSADKVDDVASDTSHVAFLLDSGFAVSDGANVTHYATNGTHSVAAGGGKVALAVDGGLRVYDKAAETDIALPDAAFVAFDGTGALVAATAHGVYQVNNGAASLVYDAGSRTVHELASSGARVWFAVDGDLGVVEAGAVSLASGGTLAPDARLVGSRSGDVWAIAGGQLLRFSTQAQAGGPGNDEATWTANIQPIYAAICSNCHSPPGSGKDSSGIDLSTYAAWVARKSKIHTRVVDQAGTPTQMPPPTSGFTLTDAQRQAIADWSK